MSPRVLAAFTALGLALGASSSAAETPRVHVTGGAARALGGHQEDEYGWGALGLAALELPLGAPVGLELELGAIWLSEGAQPADSRFVAQGDASSGHAAAGVRLRPFGGLWLAAAAGGARTGGLTRPLVDAKLGWDVAIADGAWNVGPAAGWVHVFQPNDELRPADANVLFVGVHASFDPAPPRKAALRPSEEPLRITVARARPRDADHELGVLDDQDLCPDEPETVNGYADDDGCPDAERVRVVGDRIVLEDRVHFVTNSARIQIVSEPVLERVAELIREQSSYGHIEVQGHADERGPASLNDKLSAERAESIRQFLISRQVAPERLSARGFGETMPRVQAHDRRAWFMNRRVEFVITRAGRQTEGSP